MEIFQQINRNKTKFKHLIYKTKICLICNYDEDNWNKLMFVEKMFNELDNKIERYNQSNSQSDFNIICNDYYSVEEMLNELKDDIVNKFKMPSIVMLDNMKVDEITNFYDVIQRVMNKYLNLKEASSDIFYYSGRDLSKFITHLLKYLETHEVKNIRLIPVQYFQNYANVITLEYKDWIMLFKYIRTTMKYLNEYDDNEIVKLKEEFVLLNVYYFIVISGGDH